eukprot:TRINITY_DN6855_c0_g1_i2.p1 TRINITY_DN6855_c0_g1~~TRINITY_DN6855_c0_g1_i2.p1  ORF type:complete len:114 (+),score=33.83 TRINITY_DN6855_c0_g1_i2:286-627(+)
MPLPVLKQRKAAKKRREDAKLEKMKAEGMYIKKKTTFRGDQTTDNYINTLRGDRSGMRSKRVKSNFGYEKNGMLVISKQDIDSIKGPKRRQSEPTKPPRKGGKKQTNKKRKKR